MFYTIYQITNNINGKIYIGKHQTSNIDDGYMGSGKLLQRAIIKHGIENFSKSILFVFDNQYDMDKKESELVDEQFCLMESTYNIKIGGTGGFDFINKHKLGFGQGDFHTAEAKSKISQWQEAYWPNETANKKEYRISQIKKWAKTDRNVNKFNSQNNPMNNPDQKAKHKKALEGKFKGSDNSQFGTMWITNGVVNQKIKKTDQLPDGWKKGRIIKRSPD